MPAFKLGKGCWNLVGAQIIWGIFWAIKSWYYPLLKLHKIISHCPSDPIWSLPANWGSQLWARSLRELSSFAMILISACKPSSLNRNTSHSVIVTTIPWDWGTDCNKWNKCLSWSTQVQQMENKQWCVQLSHGSSLVSIFLTWILLMPEWWFSWITLESYWF